MQNLVKILTDAGIEKNEAEIEVKLLIENIAGYGVVDIIMGKKLTAEQYEKIKEFTDLRAKTRQPIQYIIGEAYFMGDYYNVTPDVLIPRDETEIAVRHALGLIKQNGIKTVLDIGTGSGCIACSLAKYSDTRVTSADISPKALEVAEQNAKNIMNTKNNNSQL